MESDKTGVTFNNQIPNYDYINILNHEYLYNGGGVAASDINKDGLIDLVFSGNLVDNALYLNQGNFEFSDVSLSSGITAKGAWCTGVTIVDINDDGWSDIYFCTSSFNASTESSNLLFVHQGLDDSGTPIFKEQAADYGLQSGKSSMHGHFFDYDRDGDLDLYLLNNVLDLSSPTDYRYKRVNGEAPNNDQLFANDGSGKFTDVSAVSGITIEGYGLGAAIADYNSDGWLDIYVANDYVTNDILYINQKDGTFKNEIGQRLDKQSKFCMGAIAADFNNDLSLDIVTLDMLAMDNDRLKQLYAASYYPNVYNNSRYKYEEQNVRNMYHANDGTGNFSEQGYIAGLTASDWSWSPLAADFDLDGDEDLYVTNGFPKDITDLDFINYRKSRSMSLQRQELLDAIPEVKISNQLFINDGASSFSNSTINSGLDRPSISHGAVAVDLDNDGDLDIVTHNLNETASIIQNHIDSVGLTIEVDPSLKWSHRVGTRIEVTQGVQKLTRQWMPSHSYLSSMDAPLLFGGIDLFGSVAINIYWPDGSVQNEQITDISGRKIIISKSNSIPYQAAEDRIKNTSINSLVAKESTVDRRSDFDYQKTIPIGYHDYGCPMIVTPEYLMLAHPRDRKIYKLDQQGELIDKYFPNQFLTELQLGDIDRNDTDDIIYSGLKENGETVFGYYPSGISSNKIQLDLSLPLSYRFELDDHNQDGQSDLIYVAYPYKGSYPDGSYILVINDILGQAEIADTLSSPGVIRDVLLKDIDGDGDRDIIAVGHWMAPTIWLNNSGSYSKQEYDLDNYFGLWNSIDLLYIGEDGSVYFGLGNIGQNTALSSVSPTIEMVSKDIDNNGTLDPIVGFTYGADKRFIPYDLRDDLVMQVPSLKKIYGNYHDYSDIDYDDLLKDLNAEPTHLVNYVQSSILSVYGANASIQPLPTEAQIAPVYAMEYVGEIEELIVVGNTIQNREFWGSYTSSDGSVYSESNGTWKYQKEKSVAIRAEGEGREVVEWNGTILIAYRDGRLEQLNLSDEMVQ